MPSVNSQRTLARPVEIAGTGIHTGRSVRMALRPSSSGAIVFRRIDAGGREIPLDPGSAAGGGRSALEGGGGLGVETVEHLLAALACGGIDSLIAELDGPEIPALDGSALPFARAILEAGAAEIGRPRRTLEVRAAFTFAAGSAVLEAFPAPGLIVDYEIAFDHPAIGVQRLEFVWSPESFLAEIAPARTFGFRRDAEALRSRGLARGASLENTVVLDETGVLNDGLRFPDEFVRHKILDFVGDLYFAGGPVAGRFRVRRGGHALHLGALRHLLAEPGRHAWR